MFRNRNARRVSQRRVSALVVESLESRTLLHGGTFDGVFAEGEGDMVPDFALIDVNESSERYDQMVSPRDYLGQVSGWYLGNAQ